VLRALVCTVLVLSVQSARAQQEDPDTEIARRYFDQGSRAYEQGNYALACQRFEAARKVKPLPAFDYNLGRCHDRADEPVPAIEAYERFLRAEQAGPSADEARARVSVLRARLPRPEATVAVKRPVYKKWWFWTILGGVVVAGVTTTAVLLTVPNRAWQTTAPIGPGATQALVAW
jgi:tetratricopeptide (TPR) repeat protein